MSGNAIPITLATTLESQSAKSQNNGGATDAQTRTKVGAQLRGTCLRATFVNPGRIKIASQNALTPAITIKPT
ncbi:MAG: hypothetical protein KGI68_13610 [Alphaproteobacteria bacterium]|nr:hypothetical protein [Alphaproteobacteria bacterium]